MDSYSFYRIFPEPNAVKPKVHHNKKPIKQEDTGSVIKTDTTDLPQGGKKIKAEKAIKHKDFDKLAKTGNYKDDDEPLRTNRLTTLKEINRYYLGKDEIPLSVPLPMFDPSNKIHLNNEKGAITQWENYLSAKRKSNK